MNHHDRPPNPDDRLLQRYHEANQLDAARPGQALRETVLAQARSVAASRAEAAVAPAARAAANDSVWTWRAFGSLAVIGLVGLLVLQFDRGSPEEKEAALGTGVSRPVAQSSGPAAAPTAPAAAAPAPLPETPAPPAPRLRGPGLWPHAGVPGASTGPAPGSRAAVPTSERHRPRRPRSGGRTPAPGRGRRCGTRSVGRHGTAPPAAGRGGSASPQRESDGGPGAHAHGTCHPGSHPTGPRASAGRSTRCRPGGSIAQRHGRSVQGAARDHDRRSCSGHRAAVRCDCGGRPERRETRPARRSRPEPARGRRSDTADGGSAAWSRSDRAPAAGGRGPTARCATHKA